MYIKIFLWLQLTRYKQFDISQNLLNSNFIFLKPIQIKITSYVNTI